MVLVLTGVDNDVRRKGGQIVQVTCRVSRAIEWTSQASQRADADTDTAPQNAGSSSGSCRLPLMLARPKQSARCCTEGSKPARARVQRARRHSIPRYHNKTKHTPHTRRTAWNTLPIIAKATIVWSYLNCSTRTRRIDATRP